MEFNDEDLEEDNDNFEGTPTTPHDVYGHGQLVCWRDCGAVSLMKPVGRRLDFVKKIDRLTGQGKLRAGLALVFVGKNGKVKEVEGT